MHNQDSQYRAIIERYIAAYNAFDIEGMLSDMHEDVEFANVTAGKTDLEIRGRKALRTQAERAAALFNSRHQEVIDMVVRGNTVEIRIHYRATVAQDIPGGPKAGTTIELDGRSIFRFDQGKIIGLQDIVDSQ